eukprot:2951928-Karenia_brevis.AAC.1
MGKWKAFSVVLKMWKERANTNTMPPSSVSTVQFPSAMNVTLWHVKRSRFQGVLQTITTLVMCISTLPHAKLHGPVLSSLGWSRTMWK